ncbi:MAG: ribosome assembly RNA-binding protein YhbY [Firmicutes bacterium]|nr:ribosome assembly RNA-binding protein YhbY [Bacillota bacterium]
MLTSKERAALRAQANGLDIIFQVGKGGVTPELVKSIDEALEARELIKGTVLNNCMEDVKYVAQTASERTKSEVVQVIGKKIVLYRKSKKNKE